MAVTVEEIRRAFVGAKNTKSVSLSDIRRLFVMKTERRNGDRRIVAERRAQERRLAA